MKINNMNHQLKTVLILSLFMTATGCFKDEIPLELNKGSNVRLVVDAWLTDLDIPQIIRLQRTTGYLENVPAPNVSDAEVVVRYADAVVNFAFVGDGTYAAPPDWRLQTGTQYHLEVTHDGTTYRASGLLSDKPEVSNVRLEKSPDEDLVAEEIFFDLRDRAGSGDGYFAWEYSSRGSSKIIVDQGGWISDEFLDGHLLADLSIGNAYAGQEAVVLEVHSLGKEAVDYFTQLDEARYREGIFDPPPFDIPTNLSNGAVGFFVVSAVFQEKVLIDN